MIDDNNDHTNPWCLFMLWRWKAECSSIARRMELKVNDSRNELTRERRRNEELTRLLRESREKTIEVCRPPVFDSFWLIVEANSAC